MKKLNQHKNFQVIEHTADIGLKVWGRTFFELLKNAGSGMYNIMCEKKKIEEKIKKTLYFKNISNYNYEFILINFLNELLFITATKKLIFKRFTIENIRKKNNVLKVLCYGEKYNFEKHGKMHELKAATYHNLKVYNENGRFYTKIFFDV